jgi:outer membrane biogenesis lipoprotein LolB
VAKFKEVTLIFLAILLSSCAPTKKIMIEPSVEIALTKIRSRNENLKSLTANGKITIELQEYSNSANFELEIKRPDTLFMKVKTIFGINIGEIKVYGDGFELNDRFNDRMLYGNVGDYMKRFVGLNISTQELINILLATPNVGEIENSEGFVIYTRRANTRKFLSSMMNLSLKVTFYQKMDLCFLRLDIQNSLNLTV